MRCQTLSYLGITGLLLTGRLPIAAQDQHDWDRAHHVIERTREDLRHIEHRETWARQDRGHYEVAERSLSCATVSIKTAWTGHGSTRR